jgi:hypothetical protein
MTKPIIGRGLYGLWGPVSDPGETVFTQMVVREIPGIDVGRSPYRDYEVNQVAADFNAAPDAIHLLWASSLGANNCPIVALYTHVVIHGMWGFQASEYGAKVGIPANVLFAHESYNPGIGMLMTGGLGSYEWTLAPGNHVTNLITTKRHSFHPGETPEMMEMFVAEMKRVVATAQTVP